MPFSSYLQHDQSDCGPTCLRMIAKHYGRDFSLRFLKERCYIGHDGASLSGISNAAESVGLQSMAGQMTLQGLSKDAPLPCIVHWQQKHFIVVYKIRRNTVFAADPILGRVKYTRSEFLEGWAPNQTSERGVVLLLRPQSRFFSDIDDAESERTAGKTQTYGLKTLAGYARRHKKEFLQLAVGTAVASLLQLFFPFLTQSIVDFGILNRNLGFVYIVLIAQLALFLGRVTIEVTRNRMLLYLGSQINISLVSDFLSRLLRLPMSYFSGRNLGDILQRVNDQQRIQNFLASTTLNTIFALGNSIVLGAVLAAYSPRMFAAFAVASIVTIVWVLLFMRQARELDGKRFRQIAESQTALADIFAGMQEIKLNGAETQKRWQWERIQAKLFRTNLAVLGTTQLQQVGTVSINEIKNAVIILFAAQQTIAGRMTLGMMLATTYIIGILNGPIEQLLTLARTAQDTRLSVERLSEIQLETEENGPEQIFSSVLPRSSIRAEGLYFGYRGAEGPNVLKGLTLDIPAGRVTAIVGESGSGKTTLLKILLKLYTPSAGHISVGDMRLSSLDARAWRSHCGVVMQDGFLFSDSIGANIALGHEEIDRDRLAVVASLANIREFIDTLPLGYDTKIGESGHGLSYGQRQRVLIARALYNDPQYLFFDEATSSLDANNETAIVRNIEKYLRDKSVIVIAHRLSTVERADQIAVMDDGRVVECGTHSELIGNRGIYYNLIRKQLELGV